MAPTLDLGISITDILSYVGVFFKAVWPIVALLGGGAIAFMIARKTRALAGK